MSVATRRALYGKLAGDTTLNNLLGSPPAPYSKSIYYQFAPEGADFPYVIFSKAAGTPTWAMKSGGTAAFDSEIWQVKGIDKRRVIAGSATYDTADAAEAIAARVDALLSDVSLSISGRTELFLRRESDLDYGEVVDGVLYRHSGADFRLVTQAS